MAVPLITNPTFNKYYIPIVTEGRYCRLPAFQLLHRVNLRNEISIETTHLRIVDHVIWDAEQLSIWKITSVFFTMKRKESCFAPCGFAAVIMQETDLLNKYDFPVTSLKLLPSIVK